MKVAIAYLVVIFLGHFAHLLGVFPGVAIGFLFAWVPNRIGVPLREFLSGCVAAVFAVGFAFLVFRWLAGEGSFAPLPYVASILPISISGVKDYARYQRMKQIDDKASERVRDIVSPEINGAGTHVIGEIVGVLVGGYLFVNW